MGFELQVTISGLCLFVPDPDGERMHVLMPDTGHHGNGNGHSHVELHRVMLAYDRGTGWSDWLPMEDWALDLTGLATSGDSIDLPGSVVDVEPVARKKVAKKQLTFPPERSLVARITLPAASSISAVAGARWDLGSYRDVEMTRAVSWHLQVDRDEMEWQRVYLLDDDRVEALPKLRPVGNVVRLVILHEPLNPTSTIPDFPFEATHFDAFYDLFPSGAGRGNPHLRKRLPKDDRKYDGEVGGQDAGRPGEKAAPGEFLGGSPYTCMVAKAPPEGGA